ncbi:tyrosine-type recombinase/integrase [Oceanibaculum indicum]|uniref:Site-specific recombinase XerD n=1 Tax=Oceanibaculum indicum TaxID=526216 RepID=A0A420WGM0_9PROT|nr:site-specific integrase [Oceanibaculum indicum]RKQ70174.1 site-specific recombinase XerD [Oceanibaculum indicum]
MQDRSPRTVAYRGKWAVEFWEPDDAGKPCRRRTSTGLAATIENRALAERQRDQLARELSLPAGDTCQDIWTAYIADSRAIDKDRLHNAWKALQWTFGPIRPADITRQTCRSYVARREEEGVKPGTIRKELTCIRAAVNWAHKHNDAVWELPEPPPPRDIWITKDQFRKLLAAAEDTWHLTVFLHLAVATAGRKEAILQLTTTHVRWDQDCVFLGHKVNGKKRATVPINETLRPVLRKACDMTKTGYLVEYEGAAVASVRTAFENTAERAGLSQVTPHVLRHSAAVWMAGDGVPLEKISEFLGHSDIRVTQKIYARYQPDHLRDAAKSLEL